MNPYKNLNCHLNPTVQIYLRTFSCILNEMICRMTQAELSDSISYNFIVQMIPHHRAAIEMSRNILKYTADTRVRTIALQIISEQTQSIQNMLQIVCCCKNCRNSSQDICAYQDRVNQILPVMFSDMRNARSTNCIDADFMREMIPHHKGAVEMSENALNYPICQELRPILQAIIVSQKRGIAQMQQLLQCMECRR